MTPESDFHIYLTSRSSLDNFPKNFSSKFTNRLCPTLIFNNIQEWEIGLVSLILPFKTDYIQFTKDVKYEITIKKKFFEKLSNSSDDIQIYELEKTISVSPLELINLGSKRIYSIFIKKITVASNIKSNLLETYFLIYENNYLSITSHFNNKPVHDDLKDVLYLDISFNEHSKKIFGFDNDTFILYDVHDDPEINRVMGNKKINLNINHPNFILVYTDIVTPTQYGSQNISLLDVLPFGESFSNNRKNNIITYKNLNTNTIDDISIILTDPAHNILNVYSEDCVVCLNFRLKKSFFKNTT